MAYHHGTLRKYTGAILQYFNDLEVQYQRSTGEFITKKIPFKFSTREKTRILDSVTSQQILEGNYNVLPKAHLTLVSIQKAEQRTTNKNNKICKFKFDNSMEYAFNSVPYEFLYDIVVLCRGMNECSQILEQVTTKFNPIFSMNIWDSSNLSEPTSVPIQLQGITLEFEDFEEISKNIITLTFSLSLMGSFYQPIKTIPKVKEFKMYLNKILENEESTKESMLEWDVDNNGIII
jgi:hypothetical protein